MDFYPSVSSPQFVTFDEILDAKSFGCPARGTGTIVMDTAISSTSDTSSDSGSITTGRWLIVHYYLSFPVPNDMAKDLCKKIGDFEKRHTTSTNTSSNSTNSTATGVEVTDEWLSDIPVVGAKSKGKRNK